jgi:tRNA-dihydrouridine synthase B
MGAGLAIAEMLTCDIEQWGKSKNLTRLSHSANGGLHAVQIAGADPEMMAEAARQHVELGAEVIDINMGCPAKKVLQKSAGSALLKDTHLVAKILSSVVSAVEVPVTLKIRTGWCTQSRNGVQVARIAQDAGVKLLTVHGRTRQCRFSGPVEYDTIREIKSAVSIPVIANGDIRDARSAVRVMQYTGADGVMIGRAAQGRPWLFRQINHYMATGEELPDPGLIERRAVLTSHMRQIYPLYGAVKGVMFARKHVGWATEDLPFGDMFRKQFNQVTSPAQQLQSVEHYFDTLINEGKLPK